LVARPIQADGHGKDVVGQGDSPNELKNRSNIDSSPFPAFENSSPTGPNFLETLNFYVGEAGDN
jgi:hypothetical protein